MITFKNKWDSASIQWRGNISTPIRSIIDHMDVSFFTPIDFIVEGISLLKGSTETYLISFVDSYNKENNSFSIEWFPHKKYYPLFSTTSEKKCPIRISEGNIFRLIGCKLHKTTYHLSKRIRLLPTEYATILLRSQDQIDSFPILSKSLFKSNNTSISFRARVTKNDAALIHPDRIYSTSSKPFSVKLSDYEGQFEVNFIFKQESAIIAHSFKKYDWIAVWNAKAKSKLYGESVEVEYVTDTVIFIIPAKVMKEYESQSNISQSHNEVIDMMYYPDRLRFSEIKPNMYNIFLLGRILEIYKNTPTPSGRSRFGIRLKELDSDMSVDITIWDSLDETAAVLNVGQIVFFQGLSTPKFVSNLTRPNINYHENPNRKIYCISQIYGIITSTTDIFKVTPIKAMIEHRIPNAIVHGRFISCTKYHPLRYIVHQTCRRKLTGPICEFCKAKVASNHYLQCFFLKWKIQDVNNEYGLSIECETTYEVNNRLLNITGDEEDLSETEINCRIEKAISRQLIYTMSITILSFEPFSARLDQIEEVTQ